MRLFVLNASPRGARSSSKIMADRLIAGFLETSGNQVTCMNLADLKDDIAKVVAAFNESDNVIIAYPLYIDSMPALTLAFFNTLVRDCDTQKRRNIGFILPYGYPEATHGRAVKQFHRKMVRRLCGTDLGTLSRGYCNRLETLPEERTKPVFEQLQALGRDLGRDGRFNPEAVENLAGRERLPRRLQWKINLLYGFPTNSSFLVRELWNHGTYRKRNAAPYLERD